MMNENATKYRTMREIGLEFGISSHQVGKILKRNKLRTPDGRPSELAFSLEMVTQKWTEDHSHYIWIWHRPRVAALLERLGRKRDPIYAIGNADEVAGKQKGGCQ